MRTFFLVCLAILLTTSFVSAAVTVVPLDPKTKTLRISYEITDTDVGAKGFTFPPQGFDFADGPVTLLAAFDLSTMMPLEAEAVDVEGAGIPTAIKLKYPAPLQLGQSITVRFTFDVPTNNFQVDSRGRWIIKYSTSHDLVFVVPQGQQIVFADTPVKIEQDGGQVVAVHTAKSDDRRTVNFLFKTQKLP